MKKFISLFFVFACLCGSLTAQENAGNAASDTALTPEAVPPTLRSPDYLQGLGSNVDTRILTGMRDELTGRLRELTQMLGGADPQDTQYSDMLKREQTSIIEQLKQLDAQMKAAPAQPALPPLSQPPLNAPGAGIGALGAPLGGNYGDQPPTLPENWQSMSPEALSQYFVAQQQQQRASVQPPQMPQPSHTAQPPQLPFPQPQAAANESQQIMEIVQRLRESGLNDLADQTLANWQREMQARGLPSNMPTAPAAATPPIAPPPTMTPPAGFTPAVPPGNLTPSLWQPQSPQDVAELKETITKLHQQVDQLQKDVKAMETQLQLLNRNILLNQQK